MSTTSRTHPDHVVIRFDDELIWEAPTDLVDIVDLMVHGYFFTRIEIVIASSGGLTLVFDHYLAALQRWRAAGVRVHASFSSSCRLPRVRIPAAPCSSCCCLPCGEI